MPGVSSRPTYGAADVVPPGFSFNVAAAYMRDLQGPLIILTGAWALLAVIYRAQKFAPSVVAVNLIANLVFFLSHPVFTQYYLMPVAMLSVWTLLATVERRIEGSSL